MTAVNILAPYSTGTAVNLAGSRRLWRKQILRKGTIDYDGRKLVFDDDYLADLADSFKAGEYDQVPFQLATADNAHNVLPERTRGDIKALIPTPDGLDAVFELSAEGDEIVRNNPKLGVSCRIVEGARTAKRAVQHVLGTLDPRVQGMSPWQAVELSTPGSPVVDLTQSTYEKEGHVPDQLTDEELAKLRALLATDTGKPTGDQSTDSGGQQEGETLTDAELEQLARDLDNDQQPAGAALSAEAKQAIDLANSKAAQAEQVALAMQRKMWDAGLASEREVLLAKGYSPAVLDLAAPLLYGGGANIEDPTVLDLATPQGGQKPATLNVADQVRKLLETVGPQIDLSREHPFADRAPAGDATQSVLDQWEREHPAGVAATNQKGA